MTQAEKIQAALDVRLEQSDAGDGITIREYLHRLLLTLWDEGEGFKGKRPFGNSGWKYELYTPLIQAGFIEGKLDEVGYIVQMDRKSADAFVRKVIRAAFSAGAEASE